MPASRASSASVASCSPSGATAANSRQSSRSAACKGTEPPRFVGFIRDITVRRNAEEALRRSEAQLTIAQEIANLGNYVVHFDGKYEDYWSPHLYRVLGRRYGEPYIARVRISRTDGASRGSRALAAGAR